MVAVARLGGDRSKVTELAATRAEIFPARSLIHTESVFTFWVALTKYVLGRTPAVKVQLVTEVSFSKIQ